MKFLLIKLLQAYRLLISPLLGPRCRFEPSCSRYAIDALQTHGLFKGLALALNRIRRCHPLNEGGYDPVPGKKDDTVCASTHCEHS